MGNTNTMSRILKYLILLFSIICLGLCFPHPASAATKTSVKVLTVGKSYTLKNTSKVTSSKKSVAAVKRKSSTKYTVKAKKKGVSTLKVYDKKGKLTKKIYLLAVNSKSFAYNTGTVNLAKGGTKTVKGSSNLSGVTVKYSSSNSSVATVNSSGKITAKKAGSATIKAKFYYKGIKAKTVSKKVNVYTSSYDTSTLSLTEGKVKTVSASVSSNCSVKYTSSDKNIATVNSNGKITAKKAGTATITVKVYLGSAAVKAYTKKVKVTATSITTSSTKSSSDSGNASSSNSSSNNNSGENASDTNSSVTDSSSSSSSSSEYKYRYSNSSVTIAGGKSSSITAYTNKSSDVFEFVISGGDNIVAKSVTEGECYDQYNECQCRYVMFSFTARVAGTCEIKIYRNDVLVKTIPVTVTSTDDNYFGYESWRKALEFELWTSSMTSLEKIKAVGNYAFSIYPYNADCSSAYGYYWGCGADCWGSSQLLVDVAHDLGLEAWVASPYGLTYGHMVAYVIIDGKTYTLQNSANSSSPYGSVVG